jgi:predicted nucleotidyltransferase
VSADSLRTLARHLDVPERTLRRAAAQGLVHGERVSERQFRTSMREEAYLRSHWPLLRDLRAGLRTEPNVRLAVLFGSLASGRAAATSDVDVLVELVDPSAGRVAETTARLERRLKRPVQLVRLADAERAPALMFDVLTVGRVLVDRDQRWPELQARSAHWHRAALREVPLEQAMPDLELT